MEVDEGFDAHFMESKGNRYPEASSNLSLGVNELMQAIQEADPSMADLNEIPDIVTIQSKLQREIMREDGKLRVSELDRADVESRVYDVIGGGWHPDSIGIGDLPTKAQREAQTKIGRPASQYPTSSARNNGIGGASDEPEIEESKTESVDFLLREGEAPQYSEEELRKNAAALLAAAGI